MDIQNRVCMFVSLFWTIRLVACIMLVLYYIGAGAGTVATAVDVIIIISAFLCFISHLQLSAFCTRTQIEHDEAQSAFNRQT